MMPTGRMRRIALAGGMGMIVLLVVGQAQAQLLTFEFSGTIESVYEPNGDFGGAVQVGDPFTVRYTFDTAAPDLLPADPDTGWYAGPEASLLLPNVTHTTTSGLEVRRRSLLFNTPSGDLRYLATFVMPNPEFLSDAFPLGMPTFQSQYLDIYAFPGPGKAHGTIASVVLVPEPASLLLTVLSLLAVGRRC